MGKERKGASYRIKSRRSGGNPAAHAQRTNATAVSDMYQTERHGLNDVESMRLRRGVLLDDIDAERQSARREYNQEARGY